MFKNKHNDSALKSTDHYTFQHLEKSDIPVLVQTFNFAWSTPEKNLKKWNEYYAQQLAGVRTVMLLKMNGKPIGYGSLLRESEYPHFNNADIPEINDLWIADTNRKQGLGSALVTTLERLAQYEKFTHVGLGVGLYADYGEAQKLYVKRGYVPDGHGATYNYRPVVAGKKYMMDDNLILWLVKKLR